MKAFENPPFLHELESTKYNDKIKNLKNKGDVIVRQEKAFRYDKKKVDDEIKKFALSKKLFGEWEKRGIKVASIDTVFSQAVEKGFVEAYIVTENIHGKNAAETFYSEENFQKLDAEITKVLTELTKYYEQKILEGGYFINDVKWAQFVFGHKKGENNDDNHLYYVDVEPFFNYLEPGGQVPIQMVYALRNLVDLLHHAVVKRKRLKNNTSYPIKWFEVFENQAKIVKAIENNLVKSPLIPAVYGQLKDDLESCRISLGNYAGTMKQTAAA